MGISDKEVREKIARIFRAARKVRGLRQVQMSQAMEVAQGTVSKFESASLIPDAGQWYVFCRVMNLDADLTYRSGYIFSSKNTDKYPDSSFKTGKKKMNPAMKVKECIPMINLIKEEKLYDKFAAFMKANGVDVDLFVVAEFQISLNIFTMVLDFINEHIGESKLNSKVLKHFISDMEYLASGIPRGQRSAKSIERVANNIDGFDRTFDVEHNSSGISITLNEKFEYAKNDEEQISSYLDYKSNLIKNVCEEILDIKKIKINKKDRFDYLLEIS